MIARLRPGVLVVVLCGAFALPAAASPYGTYAQAMSACQSFYSGNLNCNVDKGGCAFYPTDTCHNMYTDPSGQASYVGFNSTNGPYHFFYSGSIPAANPCGNAPNLGPGGYAGNLPSGKSWCQRGLTDPNTGASVSCKMTFTPSGPPTMNQWGSWHTPGTLTASGDPCDGSGGGGTSNWMNSNGTPAGDPVPPDPNTTPPKNPPPKSCGGGSCYDPTNDQFCALSGGTQVCVPGGPARGDMGGANAGTPSGSPPGACASSGDSTICAGSPTAPTPPASKVPDAPSAITHVDNWTQANPATGTPQNVQVTTYTNQGAPTTTSGQQSGDTGPASSSSTAGTPGSYSGGGNCGTPPVCTGDAVMCGLGRQQWAAMCQAKTDAAQLHKDLTGDGPPDANGAGPMHTSADAWQSTTGTGNATADAANAGNYDATGMGFSTTCPLHDLAVPLWDGKTLTIAMSKGCEVGDWLRAIVIAFALFAAAKITAGGTG